MKWKRKKKKSHQFDLDCACEQCRNTYNGVQCPTTNVATSLCQPWELTERFGV